jgi:hypothetical protein
VLDCALTVSRCFGLSNVQLYGFEACFFLRDMCAGASNVHSLETWDRGRLL